MSRAGTVAIALIAMSIAGCGNSATTANRRSTPRLRSEPTTSSTTTVTAQGDLDPAASDTPAAGACELAEGDAAIVLIRSDFVPAPRCLVIDHLQRIGVTNETGQEIDVTLGPHFKAAIANGVTYTFEEPVGAHLAPGVHRLVFTSASAADIWVDAVCRGPGATDCVTRE